MRGWFVSFGVLALVGCTEADSAAPVVQSPALAACVHANALLTTSSPFHSALTQWAALPIGTKSALEALDFACDAANDSELGTEHGACTLLGLIHSAGEGVPKDARLADSYFRRAGGCRGFSFHANDLAQANDQSIHGTSVGCCMGRACPAGCEATCESAMAKVAHDFIPLVASACTRGRGSACYLLSGFDYGQYVAMVGTVSRGAQEDSVIPMRRACDLGIGPACASVDQHARACTLGWPGSCLKLGQDIERRTGSVTLAIPYYERSCALGQHLVCNELGDWFSKGENVPVDHDRAVRNYANAWR